MTCLDKQSFELIAKVITGVVLILISKNQFSNLFKLGCEQGDSVIS